MAWIIPVLTAVAGLWSQSKDKQAAKKADRENRRRAAQNAIMQAAAGAVPNNSYQSQAIPEVNYAGALAGAASGIAANQQAKNDEDYRQQILKIKQDQATAAATQQAVDNGLNTRRVVASEGLAAETVRANKERENSALRTDTRLNVGRMDDFERNFQNDTNDAEFKRKQLDLEGRRLDIAAARGTPKTGQLSEAELVRIATAKKEEDPIAALVAGQMGRPAPTGYKNPDSARKKAIERLKTDYNWSEQDAGDLLGNSSDPMGLR
jgi:hypothetical protein